MSNPFLNGSPLKTYFYVKKTYLWKYLEEKGYLAASKAFSLAKSVFTGRSKSFFVQQTNTKVLK